MIPLPSKAHREFHIPRRIATRILLLVAMVGLRPVLVEAAPPTISVGSLRLLTLNKETDLFIIDVRDHAAFIKGHIQDAHNILAKDVATSSLPRKNHIIVYCSEPACDLSLGAANDLIKAGYPKVQLLEGGFAEWLRRGFPAVIGAIHPKEHQKE